MGLQDKTITHYGIFEVQRILNLIDEKPSFESLSDDGKAQWRENQEQGRNVDHFGDAYEYNEQVFFFYLLEKVDKSMMQSIKLTCIKKSNYRKLMLDNIFMGYRGSMPTLCPTELFQGELKDHMVKQLIVSPRV